MYDMCTICKNTQYVSDMYIKSVCFSAFILHISGTDRCKIGVRYLIFQPVSTSINGINTFISYNECKIRT
jgi:hypothetical protein